MRNLLARGLTVTTVGALVALSGQAPASAEQRHEIQQTVTVVGSGSSVTLSRSWVYAGSIRFKVSSTNPTTAEGGGSSITLFTVKHGHTLNQVFAALAEEFSPDPATEAKGTRDLRHRASFRGLADIHDTKEIVTEYLGPGTYYAMDLSAPPTGGSPAVTKLQVRPARGNIEQDSDLQSQVHVSTRGDRFHAPKVWPHKGTYTFTNRDDTIHFMVLVPVVNGTTDAEVQAALESTSNTPPPFFRGGPGGGNDVVSPGRHLQVSYNLPRGTYLALCFISDEETGVPHAIMGMHKVVRLT